MRTIPTLIRKKSIDSNASCFCHRTASNRPLNARESRRPMLRSSPPWVANHWSAYKARSVKRFCRGICLGISLGILFWRHDTSAKNTASKYRAKPPRFGVENEEVFSRYLARYFSNRCSNHTYNHVTTAAETTMAPHTATAAHSQLSIQRRSRLSNCLCGCNALQLPLITSPETRERNIFGFGFRPLFRHGPPLLSLAPPPRW